MHTTASQVRRVAVRRPDVLQRGALWALIERERARSDRTGRPFSLVLFKVAWREASAETLCKVVGVALARARVTDDIGYYGERAIAALLPETPAAGASRFAEDVAARARQHVGHLRYVVYVYPSNWPPEGDDPGQLDVFNDGKPRQVLPLRDLLVCPLPKWKRVIDVIGGSIGLVASVPVMLLTAACVKLTSPGPVFFVQQRSGLGGRLFRLYKFRTMYVGAEAAKAQLRHLSEQDGPAFKIRNDPRITPIGRLLRKTSIDELPQLLNVLQGHMSLVGPRPPTPDEVAEYRSWYLRRLEVTPGITCIWQVFGRSRVTFEEWMRMDIRYILKRSFWRDLLLLIETIPVVVLRRGAV